MGREVRKVPADWVHPTYPDDHPHEYCRGLYIPQLDTSHAEAVRQWEEEELPEWLAGERLWATGFVKRYDGTIQPVAEIVAVAVRAGRLVDRERVSYAWWAGEKPERPDPSGYMLDWPEAERTHFMMYEDTSEGTPISPAFATPEELARWLADTGASALGDMTATYEQWLFVARGGWAPSAMIEGGVVRPGFTIAAPANEADQ